MNALLMSLLTHPYRHLLVMRLAWQIGFPECTHSESRRLAMNLAWLTGVSVRDRLDSLLTMLYACPTNVSGCLWDTDIAYASLSHDNTTLI